MSGNEAHKKKEILTFSVAFLETKMPSPKKDATSVLTTAENIFDLSSLGVEADVVAHESDDAKHLGHLYRKLHNGAKVVHADQIPRKVAKTDIFEHMPEYGTVHKPNLSELLKVCQASKFGHGTETVMDKNIRDSQEILFADHPNLAVHPAIVESVKAVASKLFKCGTEIEVVPDKLVIYSIGGHFDQHRDTVRDVNHIGTVVLTLENPFEGGALMFPLLSEKFGEGGEAVAFYTDIIHVVEPVTDGNRVAITFRVATEQTMHLSLTAQSSDDESTLESAYSEHCRSYDCVNQLVGTAEYMAAATGVTGDALPFAESEFAAELKKVVELEEKKKKPSQESVVVVFGCQHLIPAKSLELGVDGLRGADKTFARKVSKELGHLVEPVVVNVKVCGHTGEYVDPEYISREVNVTCDDDFMLQTLKKSRVLYVHSFGVTHTIENTGEVYNGNDASPSELQYVCVGIAVA